MNDYEKAIDILESVDTGIQGAKAIEVLKSALAELEEIKKRAEEYINRLEEEKRKPYHMLLLGEDEVIKLIDYIIKGEGK